MVKPILFGDMLNELLAIRGCTASQLAREINVDASYVRKWIKGTRIPSLKSDYVEKISRFLLKTSNEKNFEQYICELGYSEATPLDYVLYEAQIYSIKEKSINIHSSIPLAEKSDFEKILDSIPSFVKGRDAVFACSKLIFEAACKNQLAADRNILMTFQGEKDILDGYESNHSQFLNLVLQLLDSGWTLTHLWRLKNNDTRLVRLVNNIFNLINIKGTYNPVYFQKYGTLEPPMEFIIVGDIAAVLYISDESSDCINSALFYKGKDEIAALRSHVMLMLKQTIPLINHAASNVDLNSILNKEGDLLLYHNADSFLFENINNLKTSSLYKINLIFVIQNLSETSQNLTKLKTMLDMLEKCSNYEIAILEKAPFKVYTPELMLFKGNNYLFIKSSNTRLSIDEPTAISGFKDYFINIWDGILPKSKDKNYIKDYLNKRIQYLEQKD